MRDRLKTVLLARDALSDVPCDDLARGLNAICKHLRFTSHPEPVDLGKAPIANPLTYRFVAPLTKPLLVDHSLVLIATELPYDNNYFWDSDDEVAIISFWGWSFLTNLPKTNGLVGFLGRILAQELDPSARHDTNTGCVYDFLWDKRGIDAALRSGAMCRECFGRVRAQADREHARRLRLFDCTMAQSLEDLMVIADEVSQASKREIDILARWQTKAGVPQDFDVFLCYNSDDRASVRELFRGLQQRGLTPWFDEEYLRPGIPWQRELEATIPRIRAAAVVVGPHGQGPWQQVELEAFLREFVSRGCPVIPVFLKDAGGTPELPLFLRAFTWVDFRKTEPDPWGRLVWGVTGVRPDQRCVPP